MNKSNHNQPASPDIRARTSVSFAGCGALNFYQTGVAFALQQTGRTEKLHFLGASAGAGLAFTTAAGLDAREVSATMTRWITSYGPGRLLKPVWAYEVATRFGEYFVNKHRLHQTKGRLSISVTGQSPLSNHLLTAFESVDALKEALVASCFIPFPGKWHTNCRSFKAMDGGFTNNQPVVDQSTLRVSPFWFDPRASIRPTKRVSANQALRVPSDSECWWLFDQGFKDGQAWLVKPARLPLRSRRLLSFSYTQGAKKRAA